MNLAMGDAGISCFEAKYHFSFWRPVTATQLAADDGNPATEADAAWLPLITTPAFPEYPSAHSTVSSAAAAVLMDYFGDTTSFSVKSDVLTDIPARTFPSFSAALAEIKNARIFGGIHFRTACDDGQTLGIQVGNYVLEHAIQPSRGQRRNVESTPCSKVNVTSTDWRRFGTTGGAFRLLLIPSAGSTLKAPKEAGELRELAAGRRTLSRCARTTPVAARRVSCPTCGERRSAPRGDFAFSTRVTPVGECWTVQRGNAGRSRPFCR